MDKRPAWKEKAWAAKCHEGYADVTYEDVWSLDIRLARLIANHLRAFLKAEKGPHGGAPGRLAVRRWAAGSLSDAPRRLCGRLPLVE